MWSVPSRCREPSTAARILAGLLSGTPGPRPVCEMTPNFVATTTSSRRPLIAWPTQLLAVERAIDLGGVDMGNAQFERPVDGADRLVVVQSSAGGVGAGHGHGSRGRCGRRPVPPGRCASSGSSKLVVDPVPAM